MGPSQHSQHSRKHASGHRRPSAEEHLEHVTKQWRLFVQATYSPAATSAWQFVEPDTSAEQEEEEKVYVPKAGEASPQEFQDVLRLGYAKGSSVRLTRRITGVVADDETQRKDVTVGCIGVIESIPMDQSKRLVVVFDIKTGSMAKKRTGKKFEGTKVRCRVHVDDVELRNDSKPSASSSNAEASGSTSNPIFKKYPFLKPDDEESAEPPVVIRDWEKHMYGQPAFKDEATMAQAKWQTMLAMHVMSQQAVPTAQERLSFVSEGIMGPGCVHLDRASARRCMRDSTRDPHYSCAA